MPTIKPASPLRYPGGKQCLAPFIHALLMKNGMLGCTYAEPYAGGAGLALRLLLDGAVERVILNDKCSMVTAFWKTLFSDSEYLLRKIQDTPVSMETWEKTREIIKNHTAYEQREIAFALFFQNRTNFSGVIDGGVIGGKKQTGNYKLGARYPKERLLDLIKQLSQYKEKVEIHNADALDFMKKVVLPLGNKCFTYCDPPYFEKGQALYLNAYTYGDHEAVANFLKESPRSMRWIVSYDNAPQIVQLYKGRRIFSFDLPYSAHIVRKGKELLILSSSIRNKSLPKEELQLTPIATSKAKCM